MAKVEPKILEHVYQCLQSFGDKYIQNNKLNRYQLIQDLDHYDKDLMTRLLDDELIEKNYTEKIIWGG